MCRLLFVVGRHCVACSQTFLCLVVSDALQVAIPVGHSQGLVSDHAADFLERAARQKQIGGVCVAVVVKVQVLKVMGLAQVLPCRLDVAEWCAVYAADNVIIFYLYAVLCPILVKMFAPFPLFTVCAHMHAQKIFRFL